MLILIGRLEFLEYVMATVNRLRLLSMRKHYYLLSTLETKKKHGLQESQFQTNLFHKLMHSQKQE